MQAFEKEFYDKLYQDNCNLRKSISHFYEVSRKARERFYHLVLKYVKPGMKVLELGCGTGSCIFHLSQIEATVIGIDISEEAVRQAKEEIKRRNLNDRNLQVLEMDAENMNFPDKFFDIVCGMGILHHLNLSKAYSEVARVLKPEGRAIFLEPLGHNPLINYFRKKTPHLRTPDEHPLLEQDIKSARQFFKIVKVEWFALFSLFAIPFLKTPLKEPLLILGELLDKFLLHNTLIGKYAWQVILIMENPLTVS